MEQLRREIEANFDRFSVNWRDRMQDVSQELSSSEDKYLKSYTRLVSLQAWRVFLEPRLSVDSLAFFLEAQNDALISHVLARLGSWRSALKALRSCIENVTACLFYMDHPVELQLWHQGSHKLGFTEVTKYLERHPQIAPTNHNQTGLPTIQEEYATLSRAVHGSAAHFRMTVDAQSTLLWSDSKPSLGKWYSREQRTISGLNLLLLTLFREQIRGTSFPDLRKAVSLAIPVSRYTQVKADLGITLVRT